MTKKDPWILVEFLYNIQNKVSTIPPVQQDSNGKSGRESWADRAATSVIFET